MDEQNTSSSDAYGLGPEIGVESILLLDPLDPNRRMSPTELTQISVIFESESDIDEEDNYVIESVTSPEVSSNCF